VPAFAQAVPKFKASYTDSADWQNLVPSGTWWRNPANVARLSLTTDQQKLIDLTATLDKEEAILEPLLTADRLDEIKVAAQIDKVADARAELEKANAKMLLGIRQVLTPEQWTMLKTTKLTGVSKYSYATAKARAKVQAKQTP
jgi:Spy/CpxP family protein refolding chaperone